MRHPKVAKKEPRLQDSPGKKVIPDVYSNMLMYKVTLYVQQPKLRRLSPFLSSTPLYLLHLRRIFAAGRGRATTIQLRPPARLPPLLHIHPSILMGRWWWRWSWRWRQRSVVAVIGAVGERWREWGRVVQVQSV